VGKGSWEGETCDVDAPIQVTCAEVMLRSFQMKDVMTVLEPMVKEPIDMAIVVVATNRISWNVDLKHSGRLLGSMRLKSSSDAAASGCSCVCRSSSLDVVVVCSTTAMVAVCRSQ
jgi:hypothetical protein